MNNMFKRVFVMMLLVVIVCTNTFSASASTIDTEVDKDTSILEKPIENTVVYIESADDFIVFAKKCSLDSYSKNKTFVLKNDISLVGVDFKPVPLFSGIFDGNRHTIDGVDILDNTSISGLFCIVLDDATIKNLSVMGNIEPIGEQKTLGGIAGINNGTIHNCSFDGVVVGDNIVGGIVGINEGSIISCRTKGSLSGGRCTGGIAGQNIGEVRYCSNLSLINTTEKSNDLNIADMENTLLDPKSTEDASASVTDTGGIAGYSEGSIIDCTNNGDVGYEHIGYNVGGVAGRSVGYIDGCKNYGTIKGRKDVGGIAGQMEPMLFLEYLESNLKKMQEELDSLNNMISNTIDSTADSFDSVNDQLDKSLEYVVEAQSSAVDLAEVLGDWINDMSSALSEGEWDIENGITPDIPQLDSEYEKSLNEIDSSLKALDKQLGVLNNEVDSAGNQLETDLNQINNQQDVVNDLGLQIVSDSQQMVTDIQDRDVSVFYSDISEESVLSSDESMFTSDEGHIKYCINEGHIEADLNAGGIVGTIAIDSDLDPEDDITKNGENSPQFQYHSMAVVRDCTNNFSVEVKKNCAGGIAGRMDLGILYLCEGYGDVKSDSGGYVGGVVGYSTASVEKCYAKCHIEGVRYVGGIVGAGNEVDNCYAMVKIDSYTQFAGAISGDSEGTFFRNFFAQTENEQGVDRFSYEGRAQPISYKELIEVPDIPSEFKQFKLKFYDDDRIVDTITFEYGDSVDAEAIPRVPDDSGDYGVWSKTDYNKLTFDETIEFVPKEFIQELASEQTRSDERPIFIVDGHFKGDSQLLVQKYDKNDTGLKDCIEYWGISFSDDGSAEHKLRYLSLSKDRSDVEIYVLEEDKWEKVKTQTMGSYKLFDINGNAASIAVTEKRSIAWLIYSIIIVALAISAVVFIILRKRFII